MHNFAGLSDEDTALLGRELLRRAAHGFEQSENWRDAAQCWAELGDHQQAAALYEQVGDLEQAARARLEAKDYPGALAMFQQWEQQLLDGNTIAQVQALLGQAACHFLGEASHEPANTHGLSLVAGRQAYQQVRALLVTLGQDRGRSADAWAALGDYGVLLDRYDLVQEGYERALQCLEESASQGELVRVGQRYLAATRGRADRLLCQMLEERLASWEQVEEGEPSQPILRSFPVESLHVLHTLTGHTGAVHTLVLSEDGQTLVSGGSGGMVNVWNLLTGAKVRTITAHSSTVWNLVLSSDGQTLVSGGGGSDHTIKVWHLPSGTEMRTLADHTDYEYALALSPDGQTLVSGGLHGMIKVWHLPNGTEMRTLTGHTSYVNALALSPDGQTLVSGSTDDTIKVWHLPSGTEMRTLTGHTGDVFRVAISSDGQTLVSGSGDSTIKVWGA